MREAVLGQFELAYRGSRIAATDDAERALGRCGDDGLGDALGAVGERRNSKTPIGPFQNTVLALDSSAVKRLTDSGPMSRPILPSGMRSEATVSGSASAANLSATTMSTGRWMTSA